MLYNTGCQGYRRFQSHRSQSSRSVIRSPVGDQEDSEDSVSAKDLV